MADFKIINTQEEFDNAIKDRLSRAEQKIRDEFKGWTSPDDLKALNEKHDKEIADLKTAHSKELEKYAGYDEKFTQQESEIKTLKIGALKVKIANEKKLPFDAVEFLQGDDEKAINESADRLSKLAGASHQIGITRNTENASGAKNQVWRELASALPGHNNN